MSTKTYISNHIIDIINFFTTNHITINYHKTTAEGCQRSCMHGSMNWPPVTMLNATNNYAKLRDK